MLQIMQGTCGLLGQDPTQVKPVETIIGQASKFCQRVQSLCVCAVRGWTLYGVHGRLCLPAVFCVGLGFYVFCGLSMIECYVV